MVVLASSLLFVFVLGQQWFAQDAEDQVVRNATVSTKAVHASEDQQTKGDRQGIVLSYVSPTARWLDKTKGSEGPSDYSEGPALLL